MTCHIMTSYIVARPVAFTATLEGSNANVQSLLLPLGRDTEKRSRWYFLPVSSRGRRDHESVAHAGDLCPSSYLLWSMWKGQPSAFQTKHLSCDISLGMRVWSSWQCPLLDFASWIESAGTAARQEAGGPLQCDGTPDCSLDRTAGH